jgi:hypothetical protein
VNHLLNKIFKLFLLINAVAERNARETFARQEFKLRLTFRCLILFHVFSFCYYGLGPRKLIVSWAFLTLRETPTVGSGGVLVGVWSHKSGGRFCVGAIGWNPASVAVKMFSRYFIL